MPYVTQREFNEMRRRLRKILKGFYARLRRLEERLGTLERLVREIRMNIMSKEHAPETKVPAPEEVTTFEKFEEILTPESSETIEKAEISMELPPPPPRKPVEEKAPKPAIPRKELEEISRELGIKEETIKGIPEVPELKPHEFTPETPSKKTKIEESEEDILKALEEIEEM